MKNDELEVNNKLPTGWVETELSRCVLLAKAGGTPSTKDSTLYGGIIPFVKIDDISDGSKYLYNTKVKINSKGIRNSAAWIVPSGSLIYSMYASYGIPIINKRRIATSQAMINMIFTKEILVEYMYYYLLFFKQQLSSYTKGTTQANLNAEIVNSLPVKLPPINEQKRIVAKIEKLFSNLDNSDKYLLHLAKQLKRYRQSVLKSAFEGELTKEWRERNNILFLNKIGKIGEYCDCIVPNRDKPKSFSGNIKWITTPLLTEKSIIIDYSQAQYGLTIEEIEKYKAKVIPIGSVIMTCVGTFGLSSIVEKEIVINQQLHAFLPSEYLDKKFIAYCIQNNKKYFEENSTATTIQYLNKTKCNSMPIPIFSLNEQQEIVNQIEKHFSIIDKLEVVVQQSIKESKRLRQSILKQAFEGKLVEQDPNDESASILLEKIAKAKEEYQKAMKRKK